jgi:hydrogenase-4 component E
MTSLLEAALSFLVLANLVLVGSGRLRFGIRILACQGVVVGLLPLLLPFESGLRELALVVMSVALKGLVFPWLLLRALRAADVRHEAEPLVSFSLSILVGVLALGASLWLTPQLHSPAVPASPRLLSTALFTVLIGLFLIVSRRTALNQVMGYLVLENGIFLFGITLSRQEPLLVEMGVLLDVFLAVFVMGIAIFHISREFDHIDVDQLSSLKD